MSTSPSLPLVVACPKCGERLGVRAGDVGKRGKCRQCGEVFRIGGEKAEVAGEESVSGGAPATRSVGAGGEHGKSEGGDRRVVDPRLKPSTVTFPCELCETRITARVTDVGKAVKCPDCGRRNVIPPPAPVAAPKTPAAMSGEQFGVWGVDEGPSPAELNARTPALHPVVCGLCQTLMYATDEQVGKKLKCPDCGTLTVAGRRAPVRPVGPVIVPDGEEYQLDEASAPTPRPVYRPVELRGGAEDRAESESEAVPPAEGGSPGERRAVRPRLGDKEPEAPPRLPAVPLVQGVGRMLLTSEVLARWAALSISLTVAGWFLSWVLSAMGAQVFVALPMFAVGCVFSGVWLLSALPVMLVIVTESSEGNDRLHDPPNWMSFDFAEAFFVAMAAAVCVLPVWLSLKATSTLPEEAQAAIAAAAWLVCFPIVLLSNLEQSSAFAVFSPRLAFSVLRCAGPWLLFYIESALLAAVVGGSIYGIVSGPSWLVYLLPWLVVGTLFIYMRLVGRLAWWLAEAMPAPAEAQG